MPVAPTLLPSLGQERHEDGVKTVCQQFGFCQRLGNIAPTLFNVTDSSHLKGADFIYQGQFTRHEGVKQRSTDSLFLRITIKYRSHGLHKKTQLTL